jgi:hypothetical protein
MKRLIKRKIVCAVTLVLGALPATAQKKNSVKVEYDKFKDITCASVPLGIVSSFRQEVVAVGASVSMDASYCTPGQKLEPPSQIGVRFRSKATSWLSGMREGTPTVIFLLDGTRLALRGRYEYVIDNGGTSQITLQVGRDELIQITGSKAVEFQIYDVAYKLKQKDLAKLKDLAESGPEAAKNTVESVPSNTQPTNIVYGVNLKGFEHLEDGMTYAQVVSILGKEGTPTMDSNIGGRHIKMYQWKEKSGRGIIYVMLTDDKLKQKTQVGFD